MFFRNRGLAGLFLVAALALALGEASPAQDVKKKANSKGVTFKTSDGVDLSGTLYPSATGKRDATVILLHGFDLKQGGSSQKEGWTDLAAALQNDGYVVLSFDFRGFGDSKTISNPQLFWNTKHNSGGLVKRKTAKPPESVSHQDFFPGYIPYMVNDIAAAKAYIDKLNDNKECNSSSVILIGAGESANLASLWMASECRRARDKNRNLLLAPDIGEPESRDLAAGVWLSIAPRLGNRTVGPILHRWATEVGRANKIPQAFIFGKGDGTGDQLAHSLEKSVKGTSGKKDFALTGFKPIPGTKLSGDKLLNAELETQKWILGYLDQVMEARGARIRRDRKVEETTYWLIDPKTSRPLRILKKAGEEVPSVDPMIYMVP